MSREKRLEKTDERSARWRRAARITLFGLLLCITFFVVMGASICSAQTPSDVRPGHWATAAVGQTLTAKVLAVQTDGKFHGDAKVTRTEAAVALAALGRALVGGKWKSAGKSKPVPDSVVSTWKKTTWKTEPVRRYAFAAILARFGDYIANAVPRPGPDAKVGKSEALETPKVTVTRGSPAFDALVYLAENRMVKPGSPMLKPSDSPLLGGELSQALTELAIGVNDKLTDLGKNPDGSTPDDAFRKKPPK